jgi:hypothetical protein
MVIILFLMHALPFGSPLKRCRLNAEVGLESLYSIHIFLTKSDGSREKKDSRTDPWPNLFNHMGNFEFSFYSICSGGIKEKKKA